MPRFWGLHHAVPAYNSLHTSAGKAFDFKATPYDARMSVGDYVYLFWLNEMLYGWGIIERLTAEPDGLHQTVRVRIVRAQHGIAKVPDLKSTDIFKNWDTVQEEGCLSRFNDEQLRYLNTLLRPNSPPDPDTVRQAIPVPSEFRPLPDEFIVGRHIQFTETRFDEFKTVTSPNVVSAILDTLDDYVLSFLNLEDRRGEKFCRIFWGIANQPHTIVGITLKGSQPDEVVKAAVQKLSGIRPPLPKSMFYVERHPVRDEQKQVIVDLYVLEVGVAQGEPDTMYCSASGKFYIRVENTTQEVKGQDLIAEIRQRERRLIRREVRPDAPSFSVRFNEPSAGYNRLILKNTGTSGAKNIRIQEVPLHSTNFSDKTIAFKTIPTLGPGEEAHLAYQYGGFVDSGAQNASGIHQDPETSRYLNEGTYTLKLFFSDLNDNKCVQELSMDAGLLSIGPLRNG
jgi:hypothetical protein